MTRVLRTFGVPATVLVLAACGTADGGDSGSSEPPAASSTPSATGDTPTSPASSTSGTTSGPEASSPPRTPTPNLPTPTAPATRPTYGQGPHGPAAADFPLVVLRTGGIAGFRDKIVLQADGHAKVIRKGGPPDRCRVDDGLMEQIRAALGVTSWPAPGQARHTPPGKMSDQMVVAVKSGRHYASLDDPGVRKLADKLHQLLGDVMKPAGERTHCT